MNYFKWDNNFETGIQSVDEQHKSLVSLINEYGYTLDKEESTEKIKIIITKLHKYTEYHFKEEEKIMVDNNLPREYLLKHHNEHKEFIKIMSSLVEITSSFDQEKLYSLLDFLVDWLASHILCCDKEMAKRIELVSNGIEQTTYSIENDSSYNEAIDILQSSLFS